ncbi:hypothetical protein AB0I91_40370 [Actinosynnema sp. NPDC049800]
MVCEPGLARRALVDADARLEHVPAFWRPGGVPLPAPVCAALNRWVRASLVAEDPKSMAAVALSPGPTSATSGARA